MAPSVCDKSPKLPPHNAAPAPAPASAPAASAGQAQSSVPASSSGSGTHKYGANSVNGSLASYKMAGSEQSWPQAPIYSKENQRPPVYNPEDYIVSLRKFIKGSSSGSAKAQSIYDVNINGQLVNPAGGREDAYKSATLPAKHSGYKSPIPAPPESDSEMSLRQFGSITDLLTKLRADLRVSFPR